MTNNTHLSETASIILNNVSNAMQDAEEIWGPEDYAPLMEAIAAEALDRLATYRAINGGTK